MRGRPSLDVVRRASYFKAHVVTLPDLRGGRGARPHPAGALMRRLLCTRRQVALDTADEYLIAWLTLRNAVVAAGGRAWIFRGSGHEDQFLEFIEWADNTAEPLEEDRVVWALSQLAAFGTAACSDEWEEAT
jgi:hypothetical protein